MYCFVILLLFNEMQMSVRRFSAIPHPRAVWGINSRSHDLASKSHGESENLEIAKQFR